jgi:basic amino acid/polyamine antiporter, APA family
MSVENQNKQLLKVLGIGFGIAITVGGTIGTGILRKPGPIAEVIGSPWMILLLWLVVGIYSLGGSMCAAELGVALPKAGSWYVFAKRAFGPYFGFLTGITSWLGTVSAVGFGAYSFSEYLSLLFPSLEEYIVACSVGIIAIVLSFHLIGTKSSGFSQQVLAVIKAVGLLVFVIFCFFIGANKDITTEQIATTTQNASIVAFISALQSIFYTYDGWHTASYFSEEQKDPTKTLPKSMIYGTLSIIIIYLLVNAAILYVVPMEELKGTKLAAAIAVEKIFGDNVSYYVTMFLMISILGILNAQIMFAPRVIYSMGRDGLFFKNSTSVNRTGAPYIALITTTLLSSILILTGKQTCEKLSDIATFFFVLSYLAGFAALIRLRQKEPDLSIHYRVPFFPILPIALIILSTFFLIGVVILDHSSSLYAIGFLMVSYPLYILVQHLAK